MNTKRKSRSNGRSPRSRGTERNNPSLDGIYSNSFFMHAITSQVGNSVRVHTQTGAVFEGVFKTFSTHFELVLEMAHKLDTSKPSHISVDSVVDKLIFKPHDIIMVEITDSDLDYAIRDTFLTDTAISKFNGQVVEKELEPWDCPGTNGDEYELDGTASNGWDVDEMFLKNEQMYGVTSTFDVALSGYTMPLQNKDTKDYRDAEARAAKIAHEIENNPCYKARIDVENGDEEEKYAAVMRPGSGDSTSNDVNIKYVCPPKRKIQGSKIIRSSGSSSPSHQQLASKVSPSNYVSHPGSTGHTSVHNSRERINGVESGQPKPQRSILNTRHGRYGNNEINPRFSGNGNLNTQPTAQVNENKSSTAHSQSNIYTSTAPSNTTETASQRKPPLPNQQHSIDHQNTNIQRKLSRGREEQLTELKKFASEFKLSEACEETNKCNNENGDEDNNVVDTTSSGETPSSTSRPSTGGGPSEVDRITAKSTLNPNAKEFIYNPNSKPFTPRSPSTPTQSRPHTPQTPGYGAPPVPSIPMVMPTYVVTTAQPPPYSQPPNQQNRYRKVQMGISQRPDLASQMQVAAATGQPLLAPAPMHTQFTVPYTPQAHIAPQPYQQMVRMVAQQSSGMVPLVPAAINYPPESAAQAQLQYMAPHPHHPHHAPHHPANNPTASPQANTNGHQGQMNAGASGGGTGTGGGGGNNNSGGGGGNATSGVPSAPPPYHHTPQSPATTYTQPPPPSSANASTGPPNPQTHTYPLMCPIIPAPPPPPHPATHNPHHMMAAAAAAQNSVQFIHHHHPAQVHRSEPVLANRHLQQSCLYSSDINYDPDSSAEDGDQPKPVRTNKLRGRDDRPR